MLGLIELCMYMTTGCPAEGRVKGCEQVALRQADPGWTSNDPCGSKLRLDTACRDSKHPKPQQDSEQHLYVYQNLVRP